MKYSTITVEGEIPEELTKLEIIELLENDWKCYYEGKSLPDNFRKGMKKACKHLKWITTRKELKKLREKLENEK